MCSTSGSIATPQDIITTTCKISVDSVSAVPWKSCVHFPSYLPLFQAVGNDPVPLCYVPHITAHAIAIFQVTFFSSPSLFILKAYLLFVTCQYDPPQHLQVGRDRAHSITCCTSYKTGTGLTCEDKKHTKPRRAGRRLFSLMVLSSCPWWLTPTPWQREH